MRLTYGLDSTTVELTGTELEAHHEALHHAKSSEERLGRRMTVLVRLEIHEATEKEMEAHPLARVFPQPVQTLGALAPVVVANRLREYVHKHGLPLSDLTRTLWTEFLIAHDRCERDDQWAFKTIEHRLNQIKDIRSRKKAVSYARTRQVVVQKPAKKSSKRNKKRPNKKR